MAEDPRIDALRGKIRCHEDPDFTRDYHDPEKRSIANALTVEFADGSRTDEVAVEYPIGHARRREEGIPLLIEKFKTNRRASSRPCSSSAFSRCRWTGSGWRRCRSTSISICG